jgi:hypothetical protein
MARQEINLGIVPGDKRGDKLRVGGRKINENFTELYNNQTSGQASPVIAAKHVITEDESNRLTDINIIIPAPGAGKSSGVKTTRFPHLSSLPPVFTKASSPGSSVVTFTSKGEKSALTNCQTC